MAYELGPCEIINVTTGLSLGKTNGGVTLKLEESTVELHTDQDGENPVDEVITGTKVTVEASLADITLSNLAMSLKTTVVSDQIKVLPHVGTSLFDNAKELCIKPYINGIITTDMTKMILIPKAGIRAAADMSYNAKDQRVVKMTITGYPDSTLTGSPCAVFGASAKSAVV